MENFDEIALSRMVKEIEANLFFAFLVKIWKFKMAAIFGGEEIFLKIAKSSLEEEIGVKQFEVSWKIVVFLKTSL